MIFLKLLSPMGIDFRVYYESAWLVLHGGNPYHGIISTNFPLNYPPPVLLFIWPLGLLPIGLSGPVFNILSVMAFIVSIWLVLKIAQAKVRIPAFVFIVISFTLFYFPEKFNVGNGQINNFLLLLVTAGFYFYFRGKKNLSAILLAGAAAVKLAPLVFLLFYLIQRDYRQIVRVLVWLGVFFLLPVFIFGWQWQERYYREIFWYSFTLGAKDWYYNQSLFGFLARSLRNGIVVQAVFYGLASLMVVASYWVGRRINRLRALAGVSCLYLLIHPIALQHYFGFAIFPMILVGADLVHGRNVWGGRMILFLVILLSYLLLASNIKSPEAVPKVFNFILSHQFFGVLGLWILALFKDRAPKVLAAVWIMVVAVAYILGLLCRGGVCL